MSVDERNTRYIPIPDWSKYHPWPPIGGLRLLVLNRNTNGFHKCLKKVGKRVLIDERAFFIWMDKQEYKDK